MFGGGNGGFNFGTSTNTSNNATSGMFGNNQPGTSFGGPTFGASTQNTNGFNMGRTASTNVQQQYSFGSSNNQLTNTGFNATGGFATGFNATGGFGNSNQQQQQLQGTSNVQYKPYVVPQGGGMKDAGWQYMSIAYMPQVSNTTNTNITHVFNNQSY